MGGGEDYIVTTQIKLFNGQREKGEIVTKFSLCKRESLDKRGMYLFPFQEVSSMCFRKKIHQGEEICPGIDLQQISNYIFRTAWRIEPVMHNRNLHTDSPNKF